MSRTPEQSDGPMSTEACASCELYYALNQGYHGQELNLVKYAKLYIKLSFVIILHLPQAAKRGNRLSGFHELIFHIAYFTDRLFSQTSDGLWSSCGSSWFSSSREGVGVVACLNLDVIDVPSPPPSSPAPASY